MPVINPSGNDHPMVDSKNIEPKDQNKLHNLMSEAIKTTTNKNNINKVANPRAEKCNCVVI